ncbi:hypothetical protein PUR71_38570 [Streptomyces sp. SP17BM10]|uniref:hypothetical protein n=1 Tax=Streptomyces sp. SP17BM10 TaxID=3002530 RepID=UPI002E76F299|nr:hypothetical protein [Streptomyces sp. SP17BM10]MEE1788765.1 hypothetical protein [Streptomyces sp. SP17BM10]
MTSTALNHPETLRAFRTVRRLLAAYLAVSLGTMAAIVALAAHPDLVNVAVWIRGSAVAASSLITLVLAAKAAGGSTGAFRRLRIISTAMLVAIVVIIAMPGTFPLWMKAEQALCGALLLGVAVILNGRHLRTLFAAGTPAA